MFETLIIQPIFNLLLILYAVVGDFGVAIILFTIFIRMAMWPLLKKQLHHGRIMRKLQPEIKALRKKYKGDNQKQSQELMNLYKKYGVSPMGSFGLMFIQIPVFIGLFSALRSIINSPERIIRLPYSFVAHNSAVQEMVNSIATKTNEAIHSLNNPELVGQITSRLGGNITPEVLHKLSQTELNQLFNDELIHKTASGGFEALVHGPFFNQQLFGFIDLSGHALSNGEIYIPVMIIAILAGIFQYFQTRQLIPKPENGKESKTIRQIMSEASKGGKQPDQSEISTAMSKKMGLFFAPMITLISATSPSGLALYFATSGLVGMLQQRTVLHEDLEEMELVADVTESKTPKKKATQNKKHHKKKPSNNKGR